MNSSVDGLVVVDKPLGLTSHDVVAQLRKSFGTKKVGHAGTLDPQATGVLVLGLGKATRLLSYLVGLNKSYHAVIRLGQSTSTDDAAGEITASLGAGGVSQTQVGEAMAAMLGSTLQTPPQVSAKKVQGKKAYDLARAGEKFELAPKEIVIHRFDLISTSPHRVSTSPARISASPSRVGEVVVIDCEIDCEVSSGTYVRAMARDLGDKLGSGGHILKLRRTQLGPWAENRSVQLQDVALPHVIPMGQVAREYFQVRRLSQAEADLVRHGGKIPLGHVEPQPNSINTEAVALLSPQDELVAMARPQEGFLQPTTVFA